MSFSAINSSPKLLLSAIFKMLSSVSSREKNYASRSRIDGVPHLSNVLDKILFKNMSGFYTLFTKTVRSCHIQHLYYTMLRELIFRILWTIDPELRPIALVKGDPLGTELVTGTFVISFRI